MEVDEGSIVGIVRRQTTNSCLSVLALKCSTPPPLSPLPTPHSTSFWYLSTRRMSNASFIHDERTIGRTIGSVINAAQMWQSVDPLQAVVIWPRFTCIQIEIHKLIQIQIAVVN